MSILDHNYKSYYSLVPRPWSSLPSLAVHTTSDGKVGEGLGMRLHVISFFGKDFMIGPPKLASCNCFKGSFPLLAIWKRGEGLSLALFLDLSHHPVLQYVLSFPPSSFCSMFAYCKQSKTRWWQRPRNRT